MIRHYNFTDMKKFFTTKTITGLGILTAIMIVLFGLSFVLKFGPLTLNLALVPIAVGACLYGPLGGLFLGFINGALNLLVGEVQAFTAVNLWATIIMVLLKTSLAGLLAGFAFNIFKNKHPLLGSVFASCIVPIVNTGIFLGGCLIFFRPLFMPGASEAGQSMLVYMIVAVLGINFIIEFAINAVLSTAVHSIYKTFEKRRKM